MRVFALVLAMVPLTAAVLQAQEAPVMSVTPVSYSLTGPGSAAPFATVFSTAGNREVEFAMGTPEGSGLEPAPIRRAASRAAVQKTRSVKRKPKPFDMPWQTGVFQSPASAPDRPAAFC